MLNRIFHSKLSLKDQVHFAKRLAFLVRAVPILESLKMMQKQTKSPARSKILDDVVKSVNSGRTLSDSLSKHRHTFGEFAINIIRVGEQGGILDKNLEYLADELHKRHELRKKVIGSLVYPVFITIATLAISSMVTVFIFPKLMPIFNSLGARLPLTTRALIATSNFLLHYWAYVLFGSIGGIIGLMLAWKKIPAVNYALNYVTLYIPVFGQLSRNYNTTNFCRTFGLLLNCNVGIVNAAKITADATPNLVYKKHIEGLAAQIARGREVSGHLDINPRLFPEMVPQMVAVGEKSGKLERTLLYLSEYYENEVNDITNLPACDSSF